MDHLDILYQITTFLSCRDLCHLAQVNRSLSHHLALIWPYVCRHRFPHLAHQSDPSVRKAVRRMHHQAHELCRFNSDCTCDKLLSLYAEATGSWSQVILTCNLFRVSPRNLQYILEVVTFPVFVVHLVYFCFCRNTPLCVEYFTVVCQADWVLRSDDDIATRFLRNTDFFKAWTIEDLIADSPRIHARLNRILFIT
jgi:hypothetical protein